MRVDKIRVQNFQCLDDTGEIGLDERLTVFVGTNESGKSAILKALSYFNSGVNFQDVDITTHNNLQENVQKEAVERRDVDMVTVWVNLSDEDRLALGATEHLASAAGLKVTKRLDNEYRVTVLEGAHGGQDSERERLLLLLKGVADRIKNLYRGMVKRKELWDDYVFLERCDGEARSENLILFPEASPEIWDELHAGSWVQVSRSTSDYSGRNSRALNAGLAIDTGSLVNAVEAVSVAVESESPEEMHTAIRELQLRMNDVPERHPLRDYLGAEALKEILRLSGPARKEERELPDLTHQVLKVLPEFVYMPVLEEVGDSVAIKYLSTPASLPRSEALVASLARAAGLQATLFEKDETIWHQLLKQKSRMIGQRLRRHWIDDDIAFEFVKTGERLGIWVESNGLSYPPSRRSKGLSSYLSLLATLTELSSAGRATIVLLDDPGIFLHPTAQRRMLPLLDSQPFQVGIATHLPFMIDPDHLERVRVVVRTANGSRVERDWHKAMDSLLPVWGSVIGTYVGEVWLVVEGTTDRNALTRVSNACKASGRSHLPAELPVVPGGGGAQMHLARALVARGITFVCLADEDRQGRDTKKAVTKLANSKRVRMVTLGDIGISGLSGNFEIENLFASKTEADDAKRGGDLSEAASFAGETLDRFEVLFTRINTFCEELGRTKLPPLVLEKN